MLKVTFHIYSVSPTLPLSLPRIGIVKETGNRATGKSRAKSFEGKVACSLLQKTSRDVGFPFKRYSNENLLHTDQLNVRYFGHCDFSTEENLTRQLAPRFSVWFCKS